MTKIKYQFNTKSLAVEPVRESVWDKLKSFLRIVLAGMVFSVIVLSIGYTFWILPKRKCCLREIEQYQTNYRK
jgi:hypothetical protein